MYKKTKIVATLGPQTNTKERIDSLVKNGVNCARINTAHGTFESYETLINNTREVSDIPIMLDVKGPELRLRLDEEINIKKGDKITLSKETNPRFSYDVHNALHREDTVFVDGGQYELEVVKKEENTITLQAKHDAVLKPNKGVNIPHRTLDLPSLSEKDKKGIQFANEHNLEYIALSFVRSKEDIKNLRERLSPNIAVIAKIENWEGVENLDGILSEAEGVMVARGDLGIEIGHERVPAIQKEMVQKAHQYGKMSIVATQMLETMTTKPSPTRAEVSDVANAVIDGADAVMLSGETAIGKYPVQTVSMMSKIAKEAEKSTLKYVELEQPTQCQQLSKAAHTILEQESIDKMITLGKTLKATLLVTRYRNHKPVIGIVPTEMLKKQLHLCWGVKPFKIDEMPKTHIIPTITEHAFQNEYISNEDNVVYVAGVGTKQDKVNLLEQHNVHRYRWFHGYTAKENTEE